MHLGTILASALTVAGKELRMASRDRQTVLYTVWLPLLLYPALFWILIQGMTILRGRDATTAVTVGLAGPALSSEGAAGTDWLRLEPALAGLAEEREDGETERAPGPLTCLRLPDLASLEAARAHVRSGEGPDAVLWLTARGATLLFDGTESTAQLARARVEERMARLAETLRIEAVRGTGADPAALVPYRLEDLNLASARELSSYFFSFILPMTFVLMAVMGAFYPAVDCTAGEKERRTVESTLLLATPRVSIQLGKVLAVTLAAAVATVLNLLGLVLAAEPLLASLDASRAIEIPWTTLLLALPLCGAFLFTCSALLLSLASFTDTFKQGQSLLGVVQLLFILPAMFAVLPNVQLSPVNAWVPVVQTVLAFKALLAGEAAARLPELAQVFLSQALYAALAIALCVRLASLEALQTAGGSLRRIAGLWSAGSTPR